MNRRTRKAVWALGVLVALTASWACGSGDDTTAENTSAACRDGVDNDHDGDTDCDDPECATSPSCAPKCVSTPADPSENITGTEEEPAVSANSVSCPSTKVLICHRPPGNPANEHTLCVGAPAVSAHLTHHPDSLGACGAQAGQPPVLNCANPACDTSPACSPGT